MSAQIALKDLSSFFELFVAYTFAYNSLDTFKNAINKASVKDLAKKVNEYELKFNIENEKVQDLRLINDNSSDLKRILLNKIELLSSINIKIQNLNKVASIFYSGDFLKPLFYLTGAIYLFYIILSAYQNLIGDLSVFMINSLIFVSVTLYYIIYYLTKMIHYKKFNFEKITWKFETKRTLKQFGIIVIVLTICSILISKYIHYEYPHLKFECEKTICSFVILTIKDVLQLVSTFMLISFAIIPFLIYYFREKLILKNLNSEIEKSLSQFEELFDEIQVISKTNNNPYDTSPIVEPIKEKRESALVKRRGKQTK